jgi:hypothetical protein
MHEQFLKPRNAIFSLSDAKCTMQPFETNTSIFFVIFLLKFFQDEKKKKSYANIFLFQITMQINAKKERDLTSRKTSFFFFFSFFPSLYSDDPKGIGRHPLVIYDRVSNVGK